MSVSCRICKTTGTVKPHSYGGWYKSKLLRRIKNKWFCPTHYTNGKAMDNKFYEEYKTPQPTSFEPDAIPLSKSAEQELIDLFD